MVCQCFLIMHFYCSCISKDLLIMFCFWFGYSFFLCYSTARVLCTLVWPLQGARSNLGWSSCLVRKRSKCSDSKISKNLLLIPSFFLWSLNSLNYDHYVNCVVLLNQDATANDIRTNEFDVKGFPTLYFKSASGKLSQYNGERTKEAIIEFIQQNRDDKTAQSEADSTTSESVKTDSAKDEL